MISIVALSWNSEKYITKCLDSVIDDCKFSNLQYEILITDNGSTDNTVQILKNLSQAYNVKAIFLDSNKGTTCTRNMCIKRAKGDYLFIIDSDTIIQKGTIASLITVLKNDPSIGIVAPRLLYENGKLQASCRRFPTLFTKLIKLLPVKLFKDYVEKKETYKNYQTLTPVDYCISACWMLPRKTIERCGLFDEKIFYGPEDLEYCIRVWENGLKIIYIPKITSIHACQRISYKFTIIALKHFKDLIHVFHKHKYWLRRNKLAKRLSII